MGVSKVAPGLAIFVLFNNQKLPCLLGSTVSVHLAFSRPAFGDQLVEKMESTSIYTPSLDSYRGNINKHKPTLSKKHLVKAAHLGRSDQRQSRERSTKLSRSAGSTPISSLAPVAHERPRSMPRFVSSLIMVPTISTPRDRKAWSDLSLSEIQLYLTPKDVLSNSQSFR